jgi:hypothetical protein
MALALSAAPASAGLNFSATSYSAGASPIEVGSTDFNGDGALDVVAARNTSPGAVAVLLNNGSGALGSATPVTAGGLTSDVTFAPFDAGSNLDLVASNQGTSNFSVFLGNGSGGFGAATNIAAGGAPTSLIATPFNAHIAPDLAFTYDEADHIGVLLSTGSLTFAAPVEYELTATPGTGTANQVQNADLTTGDAVWDLVTANPSGGISSFVGNSSGTGAFTRTAGSPYGSGGAYSLVTRDFDGDELIDVATADVAGSVSLYPGNGDGSFDAPAVFSPGAGTARISAGDFNSDGKADVVTSEFAEEKVDVWLNTGTGFAPPVPFTIDGSAYGITVSDLNNDEVDDIVTANIDDSNVSVLLNTTTPDVPGGPGPGPGPGVTQPPPAAPAACKKKKKKKGKKKKKCKKKKKKGKK